MVQAWAVLVVSSNQQCYTEGSAHDALLAICRLAKAQGQVADGLGARLDAQGLVVVEGVALALNAGVLHHAARIGLETTHCATNVPVNLDNLFNRRGLEEGRCHALFDTEHDALIGRYADCCGAELDGFEGVLDLEETAFWGKGVDSPV
jgi:hypothetical protein